MHKSLYLIIVSLQIELFITTKYSPFILPLFKPLEKILNKTKLTPVVEFAELLMNKTWE